MNQGRIWCVVNPSVGLPAFLGSVALISFTVHFAVIENADWAKRFFQGADARAPATASAATPVLAESKPRSGLEAPPPRGG
jgi:light-harvesting protein B-800-850 alpha chain